MAFDDQAKQDMDSGLEHAVRAVQARFNQLEQNVLIPGLDSSRRFAKQHSITSTFIGIFLILGLFPIISFLGFVFLVSATFGFVGFAAAFVISSVLIIVAGGLLTITLGIILVASIFLTFVVVSLSMTARLAKHLRSEPRLKQGIAEWVGETRNRLSWRDADITEPTVANVDVKIEPGRMPSDEWQAVNNGQS